MEKECCFNCGHYNGSAYISGGGKLYCGFDQQFPRSIKKNVKSFKCKNFDKVRKMMEFGY